MIYKATVFETVLIPILTAEELLPTSPVRQVCWNLSVGQTVMSLMWLRELFCGTDNIPVSAIKTRLFGHKIQHWSETTFLMSWCKDVLYGIEDSLKRTNSSGSDKSMYTLSTYWNFNYSAVNFD